MKLLGDQRAHDRAVGAVHGRVLHDHLQLLGASEPGDLAHVARRA